MNRFQAGGMELDKSFSLPYTARPCFLNFVPFTRNPTPSLTMSQQIIAAVEAAYRKPQAPKFSVGDNVDVHVKIVEGVKERIQVFSGVVLKEQGAGVTRMFTVRRITSTNEGVERSFPIHSPRVVKVEVIREGDARRAKLYFLRDRVGKSRRLRDKRRGLEAAVAAPAAAN